MKLFFHPLDVNRHERFAGERDVPSILVGVSIIVLFLECEFAGHRRHGHVPSIEDFNGELHAVGGLEFAQRRLGNLKLPIRRRLLAEINQIVFSRLAADFGMLR